MGFFDNIQDKQQQKLKIELEKFLLEDEIIDHFFMAKEDFGALTDKRLIFVDKSLFSNKKSIVGVPFKKINAVGVKRGGTFSISKEIIIMIGSQALEIDTYDENQAIDIYKRISSKIL